MIDAPSWMAAIVAKLKLEFGDRLLFVGLQGSYRRGEASETSDIDVVLVLDELSVEDLAAYRAILQTMPEPGKACGFVCGRTELLHWPRHEVFQLLQDTQGHHGSLGGLLPAYGREDVRQSARIAAANLYHAACHQYLFGPAGGAAALQPLYKSAFFILQLVEYLRSGVYHHTKAALLAALTGEEKALLETGMAWGELQSDIDARPGAYYEPLIGWCKAILWA